MAQILVNACRRVLRGRRRAQVREIPVDDLADAGRQLAGATRAPATGGPAETAGQVEAIRRAFERLDPNVRALLVLHYVEERPIAEIGQILRAPVGTIKWRLSRARASLSRALEVEER